MEDLRVMCVVYVSKDAEELAVDVLDGGGEGLRKVVTCGAPGKPTRRSFVRVLPDLVGNTFSSSSRFWTQVMT